MYVTSTSPIHGPAPQCVGIGGSTLLLDVSFEKWPEVVVVDLDGKDRPGTPVARLGDTREVAAVVTFLCGPEAGCVSGASWVSGGEQVLTELDDVRLPDESSRWGNI